MWQRFTESARRVILLAQQKAVEMRSLEIEPEHLLLGLLENETTIPARILADAGLTKEEAQQQLWPTEVNVASELRFRLSSDEVENLRAVFKINAEVVRAIEDRILLKLRAGDSDKSDLKLSAPSKRVLELSADEARRMFVSLKTAGDIGPDHLMLGLLRDKGSKAAGLLNSVGLNLKHARTLVAERSKSNIDEAA